MVAHVRTEIRARVATLLTGLATTGNSVLTSIPEALDPEELPALVIYTAAETIEDGSFPRPRVQHRLVDLMIEGCAQAVTGVEDTLDQMALEVEQAIASDNSLGGLVHVCTLQSTETQVSTQGEIPTGSFRMTYSVLYTAREDNPTA